MKIEIRAGETIYNAVKLAGREAWRNSEDVEFEFNEIPLVVSEYSHVDDILRIYDLKCKICRLEKE